MNMTTQLITWIIMSYGLMNIMVYGSIFLPFRNFLKKWALKSQVTGYVYPFGFLGEFMSDMISCAMCFSVWGGFFLSLIVWSPSHEILGFTPHFSWFFDGIISSGSVWAINSIIEWFEENRPRSN